MADQSSDSVAVAGRPMPPLWRWMLGGLLPPFLFMSVGGYLATGFSAAASDEPYHGAVPVLARSFAGAVLVPAMTAALAFFVNFFFLQRLKALSQSQAAAIIYFVPILLALSLIPIVFAAVTMIAPLASLTVLLGIGAVHAPTAPIVGFFFFAAAFALAGAGLGAVVSLLQGIFAPSPAASRWPTRWAHVRGGAYSGAMSTVLLLGWPYFAGTLLGWKDGTIYVFALVGLIAFPHALLTYRALSSWPASAFSPPLSMHRFLRRLSALCLVIAAPAALKIGGLL